MSAERERGGRLALSPWWRAWLGVALVVCLTTIPLSQAATNNPSLAATAESSDEAALELIAAPASSGVVRPGEPASVRVTITNTGTVNSGDLIVRLGIDGSIAASPENLTQWFSGATIAANTPTAATARVDSVDPGASAVLDLIIPDVDAVFGGPFGARLATITASTADARADAAPLARDRTAVVWVPAGTSPPVAATTFVAAITTPGEPAALLSAEVLARYTAAGGPLSRTLDAVAGRPVLLAVDPRVIASIRVLGDEAPADAVVFLERLLAAPNESFVLPWADADPLVTIAADASPLPRPEGTGIASEAPGTTNETPSPSPSPDDTVTLDELAEWSSTLGGIAWAESGTLTSSAVSVLSEDGTSVLFAPGSSLDSTAPVQQIGSLRVLRTDDVLSSAARAASLAVSEQRFDQSMARVSAMLASSAAAVPGIPVIIPLERNQLAGTDRLIDTIAQTVALPWASGALASDALSTAAVDSTVIEPVVDETRVTGVRAALEAEAHDRAFASIAVTPAAITDVRRLELLAALSLGWGDESVEALQQFVRESAALRSSVQVVESSAITLLADRASLPVTVQNDLDVAVRVFVKVDPDTTQLRVLDTRVETVVEPRSQTRARVPVESLTNGQVDITVSVRDADNTVIGDPTRVALNLQAGWETAGTIAIAIALVLLLGFGIVRDVRKRRRPRVEEA